MLSLTNTQNTLFTWQNLKHVLQPANLPRGRGKLAAPLG